MNQLDSLILEDFLLNLIDLREFMTESKRYVKPLQEIKDEIEGMEELLNSPIFDEGEKEKIKDRLDMLYKKLRDYED